MPDPRWDESQVDRVLEWFERKRPRQLIARESLRDLGLDELRGMFGVKPDDAEDPPMFDCYGVEPHHVERLQGAVDHQIDPSRFEYFVSAYQKGS